MADINMYKYEDEDEKIKTTFVIKLLNP